MRRRLGPTIATPTRPVQPMTRSSPLWLLIAFGLALLGVGFPYWQVPYSQVSLPNTLYGPGLVAVAVIALMVRSFGLARFWNAWLLVASAVPAAVLLRIAAETSVDPTSHNLWPFEVVIAVVTGLVASLPGVLLGSVFLRRSSKRP